MRVRTGAVVSVAALASALLLLCGPAVAQGRGALRECFGPGPLSAEEAQMQCVKYEGGEWQPVGGTDVTAGPEETVFSSIVFLALLLSLVPAFAGAALASSAKISPVVGFLIGLFGSWVGLIALYLYGHSQSRSSDTTGAGSAVEGSVPDATDAAERLRTLQDLLDQGLITQDEYRARRQAAIDAL